MTDRRDTALPAASQPGSRVDRIMWAVVELVRRHWMFWLLLAGGLVLRAIAQVAYEPALLFIDSKKYIFGTDFNNTIWGSFDPLGYSLLILRPVLMFGRSLAYAALAQHVLGMAMAGALYALMVRRGVYRWLAALAVAPVLFDAYQLNAEQTIMPDVLFEALLVAGIVLLLWRPRPGLFLIILGGLALGASAPVRQVGEALIAPALIYVVFAAQGWWRRLLHGAVLTACFALPIVGYMSYSAVIMHYGFELSNMGNAYLYGRAAHAADCATLKIPANERPLCPNASTSATLGVDGLVNASESPRVLYQPVNIQLGVLIDTNPWQKALAYSVLKQQPMRVAGDIARDSVKIFALTRNTEQGDTQISRWQFQFGYPYYPPGITRHGWNSANKVFAAAGGGGHARVHWKADIALRYYQLHGGYTPGPVFLFGLLAGIAGIFTFRRRRDSGPALACLLITGCAVAVLLGADLYEFSWRYQLPALVTLPVAGAFGITALVRFFGMRRQSGVAAGVAGADAGAGVAEVARSAGSRSVVGVCRVRRVRRVRRGLRADRARRGWRRTGGGRIRAGGALASCRLRTTTRIFACSPRAWSTRTTGCGCAGTRSNGATAPAAPTRSCRSPTSRWSSRPRMTASTWSRSTATRSGGVPGRSRRAAGRTGRRASPGNWPGSSSRRRPGCAPASWFGSGACTPRTGSPIRPGITSWPPGWNRGRRSGSPRSRTCVRPGCPGPGSRR